MRYSVALPDDVIAAVRKCAEEAGITQAELTRRALIAYCTRSAPLSTPASTPPPAPAGTPFDAPLYTPGDEAIQTAIAARDEAIARATRAEADLATITAERDTAREDLATAEDQAHALELRAIKAETLAGERDRHADKLLQALAAVEGYTRPRPALTAETGEERPGLLDKFLSRFRRKTP